VLVTPDARIFGCDSAFWEDSCCFDQCEAGSSGNDASEMCEVPACEMAILCRVLAERTEHDTVLQCKASDGERLEEFGDRLVVGLRIGCCSRRRDLSWCEVRDLPIVSWGSIKDFWRNNYSRSCFVWNAMFVSSLAVLRGESVVG